MNTEYEYYAMAHWKKEAVIVPDGNPEVALEKINQEIQRAVDLDKGHVYLEVLN